MISDVHGNNHALDAVLEDIQKEEIDQIIVAGDSTGILNQNKVFKDLREKNTAMIRGNGEKRIVTKNRGHITDNVWNQASYAGNRWIFKDIEPSIKNFLEFLPDQRVVELGESSPILVVHGSPKDNYTSQGILPEQSSHDSMRLMSVHSTIGIEEAVEVVKEKVMICGHTHRPWVHEVNDVLVVNPGSVGNPCNGDPRADYAILTWESDHWSVNHKMVEYDLNLVYNQFIESDILDGEGVFARLALLGRLTGIDVNLDFLVYVKTLVSQEKWSYEQAYTAAANSFDWQQYKVDFKI